MYGLLDSQKVRGFYSEKDSEGWSAWDVPSLRHVQEGSREVSDPMEGPYRSRLVPEYRSGSPSVAPYQPSEGAEF